MWDAVCVVVRDRCSRVRMKGIPWSDRPDSPPQRRRLRDRGQLRGPARMRHLLEMSSVPRPVPQVGFARKPAVVIDFPGGAFCSPGEGLLPSVPYRTTWQLNFNVPC